MVTLDKIYLDEKVKVVSISDNLLIKRRLLDIGIIPGIDIQKVLISPFRGMSAYQVMDAIIAIRDSDAKGIEVCYGK